VRLELVEHGSTTSRLSSTEDLLCVAQEFVKLTRMQTGDLLEVKAVRVTTSLTPSIPPSSLPSSLPSIPPSTPPTTPWLAPPHAFNGRGKKGIFVVTRFNVVGGEMQLFDCEKNQRVLSRVLDEGQLLIFDSREVALCETVLNCGPEARIGYSDVLVFESLTL
jgi:hypothetical protein